jgi:hypothetical protein
VTVAPEQSICAKTHAGAGYSETPSKTCVDFTPADPLQGKPAPTVGNCVASRTDLSIGSNQTLSPGTYCKKLEINSGATVTLNSGVYVLRGTELIVNSGSKLKVAGGGDGVLIYLTYDAAYGESSINVNSLSTMDLRAMTSGDYAGILFYQKTNANNGSKDQIFNSGSTGELVGRIYFPDSRVVLNSDGVVDASCGTWIAKSFYLNSDAAFSLRFDDAATCGMPVAGSGRPKLVN